MMLLRTLVLERSEQDAPVNGALLCGFAVAQIDSNFLVYSLDEETEPGNSRVYIAALRKKLERYFLSSVESKEDLQVAMQVFKQILTAAAASGSKGTSGADTQIPYHFIDLKGCKLPVARPEDHHSMIIKKALVMKVITLGMSAPMSPPIESAALIVPSIRFSSQTVSTLLEVDSTLSNLAKVAQELAQQKLAVIEREEMLEQWEARLQQAQGELEDKRREHEQRDVQLQSQKADIDQRSQQLALAMSQLSGTRQRLQSVFLELDQALGEER